jgi:hypothetical protein
MAIHVPLTITEEALGEQDEEQAVKEYILMAVN